MHSIYSKEFPVLAQWTQRLLPPALCSDQMLHDSKRAPTSNADKTSSQHLLGVQLFSCSSYLYSVSYMCISGIFNPPVLHRLFSTLMTSSLSLAFTLSPCTHVMSLSLDNEWLPIYLRVNQKPWGGVSLPNQYLISLRSPASLCPPSHPVSLLPFLSMSFHRLHIPVYPFPSFLSLFLFIHSSLFSLAFPLSLVYSVSK